MSGYDPRTGIFELTSTKAGYWLRREELPDPCLSVWQETHDSIQLTKCLCEQAGYKVLKDGGSYLHIEINPDQLWELLSGQSSDPRRSAHYYKGRKSIP